MKYVNTIEDFKLDAPVEVLGLDYSIVSPSIRKDITMEQFAYVNVNADAPPLTEEETDALFAQCFGDSAGLGAQEAFQDETLWEDPVVTED